MSDYRDAELILGLVGPVGTDFELFTDKLQVALRDYRYEAKIIRLASLANAFGAEVPDEAAVDGTDEFRRLTKAMNAGNAARHAKTGDVLALAAAAQISAIRPVDRTGQRAPVPRAAYLLKSLKHPAEVFALRRIYGPGFFLIGVLTTEEERREQLRERKGCTRSEIDLLLERDSREADDLGQRTRDTFHLADVFLHLEDTEALRRFLRLVFAHPYETPTPDEYAMFMAFSAALRSADLSRQVGAVVTSPHHDILGVGANDVPIAGGGLQWPGPEDTRDHRLGVDKNEAQRGRIIDEILRSLLPAGEDWDAWAKRGRQRLKNAAVMDITEFGRAVHAEMEALLSCTRSGVSPRGGTLFSTTFPCHNCAKHIIASGISRVVYVEPYPKSQAIDMYPESITTCRPEGSRVLFEAFTGVGPRRFLDLFSMGLSSGYHVKRKGDGGVVRNWLPDAAEIRVPLLPNSYIVREQQAAEELTQATANEEIKR